MRPLNAQLFLTAEKSQCDLGSQLKGTIKLCSDEEFDARQLVVQLVCVETVMQTGFVQFGLLPLQNVSFNNVEVYRDWRVLFGAVRVPKGFDTTYSYTLNVSAGAKETFLQC